MQLSTTIFKAYDIRGIVPATIDEAMAEALGRAFGTVALKEGERTVAVGRDGRLSGPALSAALTRGLVAAGVLFPEREVIDVSILIAAERGGFDAVRVMGVPLGIDELVISRPCGAGFGFEVGRENDDAAVALAEVAEDGLGIGGEQEVR